MKKYLIIMLCAALLASLVGCGKESAAPAEPEIVPVSTETPVQDSVPPTAEPTPVVTAAGKSGENVEWSFEGDTLTITGSGVIDDYESFAAPWDNEGVSIKIKKLVIGEGIRAIGANAFGGCYYLEKVTLPSTLQQIGTSAFTDCAYLKSLTLPDGLFSIGDFAFMGSGLTGMKLPASVAVIGMNAFSLCVDLKSITMPEQLAILGEGCFGGCDALTTIYCVSGTPETLLRNNGYGGLLSVDGTVTAPALWSGTCGALEWTLENGVLAVSGKGELPDCSASGSHAAPWSPLAPFVKSIELAEGVTRIGSYAFWTCGSAVSVRIPEGVRSIGECGFGSCASLTEVTLPASLRELGKGAFSACASLRSVTIPDGCESVGDDAFHFCPALASVDLPASVKTIGGSAFDETTAVNRLG